MDCKNYPSIYSFVSCRCSVAACSLVLRIPPANPSQHVVQRYQLRQLFWLPGKYSPSRSVPPSRTLELVAQCWGKHQPGLFCRHWLARQGCTGELPHSPYCQYLHNRVKARSLLTAWHFQPPASFFQRYPRQHRKDCHRYIAPLLFQILASLAQVVRPANHSPGYTHSTTRIVFDC